MVRKFLRLFQTFRDMEAMLADSLSTAERLREERGKLYTLHAEAVSGELAASKKLIDYLLIAQGKPPMHGNQFPVPEPAPLKPLPLGRRTAREVLDEKTLRGLSEFYGKTQ